MGPIEAQTRQEAVARRARLFSPPPPKAPVKPPVFLYKGKPFDINDPIVDPPKAAAIDPDKSPVHRAVVRHIVRDVAEEFGFTQTEIMGRLKTKDVARARQIVMYLAKRHSGHSYPEIGRRLGGRDHTTIMHGCRTIEREMQCDPEMVGLVEKLEARVSAQ
jgi:hypothetical protein